MGRNTVSWRKDAGIQRNPAGRLTQRYCEVIVWIVMIPKCELEELPIQGDQMNCVIRWRDDASRHIGVAGRGTQQDDENTEMRIKCSI